jgi:hypothetical protein
MVQRRRSPLGVLGVVAARRVDSSFHGRPAGFQFPDGRTCRERVSFAGEPVGVADEESSAQSEHGEVVPIAQQRYYQLGQWHPLR